MNLRTSTTLALGAMTLVAAGTASAQVSIYGIIDTSLRYQNNTNASTASDVSMQPGAYGASRVGFRGREDLGNGLYSEFQLENGFNPNTGAQVDSTRLFNRHSWVGLGSKDLGRISFGRQYALTHEVLAMNMCDVLGVGGYDETAWFVGQQYTLRYDNSIKYRHTIEGVQVGAMYVLSGEQHIDDSYGLMAMIPVGPVDIGLSHHSDEALNGKRTTNLLALKYRFDNGTTLHGYTMYSHDKRGVDRKDRLYALGFIHPLNQRFILSGTYYRNLTQTPDSGGRSTFVTRLQYALSKRSELYLEADYSRVSGVTLSAFNQPGKVGSNNSRTTFSVGYKHMF
ncbi:porin [Pusillimonas sp. CC-YST705]|uniref:Porin n=1 Tax=Mesopusillimonas faecipullorum TaxID=2755040 RepID=A0ABS8CED2_9BURK|nr:porin [Mesopusillimonas faecipullorum]MCB5364400.1 porin [Mesopusillimonas faecipullorum]